MNKYHIFFRKLANPLKVEIISALKQKPYTVKALSKKLKIEQSKLSHALISLACCRIVQAKQRGRERVYSLNKETIIPILKLIDKHEKKFCKCCYAMERK